jgi:hypothetical protein
LRPTNWKDWRAALIINQQGKEFTMKAKSLSLLTILFSCLLVSQPAETLFAQTAGTMELVQLLTSQLGVTENQATGGAGALFGMAKGSLSETDFAKVAQAVPGVETLINAAPAVAEKKSEMSGQLGGIAGGLGALTKAAESTSKLAAVAGQFSQLGMDQGMVSQFIPVILSFVNAKGGESVMKLLQAVWQ